MSVTLRWIGANRQLKTDTIIVMTSLSHLDVASKNLLTMDGHNKPCLPSTRECNKCNELAMWHTVTATPAAAGCLCLQNARQVPVAGCLCLQNARQVPVAGCLCLQNARQVPVDRCTAPVGDERGPLPRLDGASFRRPHLHRAISVLLRHNMQCQVRRQLLLIDSLIEHNISITRYFRGSNSGCFGVFCFLWHKWSNEAVHCVYAPS